MLTLQNISFTYPGSEAIFTNIDLAINLHDKTALVGSNGSGKSTLLKIIAGELKPSSGQLKVDSNPYCIPQVFGQFDHLTVAQALHIEDKLDALKAIIAGDTCDANFNLLNEDWTIEERCKEALEYWELNNIDLQQKLAALSGGQKTKLFLAGIFIHEPRFILMDEPSNHLDLTGRQLLYDLIEHTSSTLIVVSHDRKLLNLLNATCELSKKGIATYGGNFNFYTEQKQIEDNALNLDVLEKEKALRKARAKERETLERQQKLNNRGKAKQEKAGIAKIMMNTLRNSAEKSTSKIKGVHEEKTGGIAMELKGLRSTMNEVDRMKFDFNDSALHKGKILFEAKNINYSYGKQQLWKKDLNFIITSGERIALKGDNGSGKTTLIKLILGEYEPNAGFIHLTINKAIYIDQDYALLNNRLSVYEQAQLFNKSALQEHEIKIRLSRFLFTKDDWNKPCQALSGGERMRLMICCLNITNQAPDMIILDEPTNNLDIQNLEILAAAINEYRGSLIVVSHDETFLEQVNAVRVIQL